MSKLRWMRFHLRSALWSLALAFGAAIPLHAAGSVWAQTGSPCDSETVVPVGQDGLRADCEALWGFYTQLDDPGLLDGPVAGRWGPDTPLSSWRGVKINPTSRRVTRLTLGVHELTGTIPIELTKLANLTHLDLYGNKLTGPIPAELSQLTNLTYLSLFNNDLTGTIPAQLGQLINLNYLNFAHNELTGTIPAELNQLTNLNHLNLYHNELTGTIPAQLGQLTNLADLILTSNRLTGPIPAELGQLTNLNRLNLGYNELTETVPAELGQLINLVYLNLRYNKLTGTIPAELGQLTNLNHLNFSYNMLTGPIPAELGQLTNLTDLILVNNRLTGAIPAELDQLTNLKRLNLGENPLEDHPPPGLSQFNPYESDPLGLIVEVNNYRKITLGDQVWDVWFCDHPAGDVTLIPSEILTFLHQEITPYFSWLSEGHYQPRFQYIGTVKGGERDIHWERCRKEMEEIRAETSHTRTSYMLITDQAYASGAAAGGAFDAGVGTAYFTFARWQSYVIAHEMGHGLGFPHSYGGNIISPYGIHTRYLDEWPWIITNVDQYDNPMDIMSGSRELSGTVAINRYAAGWIDPVNVTIHPEGKTHTYELRPPGSGGTQMLVLPDPLLGTMYTLGARVAKGYDSGIPIEGIETYRVQSQNHLRYTRIQPFPPATDQHQLTQHVHGVGEVFKAGTATVEVLERIDDNFRVRVVDTAEPRFVGRFSDDDDSAHEANIEAIAARGITTGCSPTYPDRFCPDRVVTRAQVMAFLARALGEEGYTAVTTSRFTDVPGHAWYLPYLERLADLGVVTPNGGAFRPLGPLTRRDMAVFLTRAFSHISPVAEPAGVFADVPADAPHAAEVEAILAAGVTRGCSAESARYCPDETVTRAQMASFLTRALQG